MRKKKKKVCHGNCSPVIKLSIQLLFREACIAIELFCLFACDQLKAINTNTEKKGF